MVGRKKNLLDAFQASALEGRAVKERKNVQASAGGPFASASPRAKAEAGEGGLAARALRDPVVRAALGVALVAIGGAYWLGTRSGGADEPADEVQAAAPGVIVPASAGSGAAPSPDADLARLNQQRAQTGTTHDQQFLDKKNQFTIRLVQYRNDEAGLRQAKATFEYLRREGLPAVAPISIGKGVIVCVDSKPRKADLDAMLTFVQKMAGPDGSPKRPPFADAFVVNIDDVLER